MDQVRIARRAASQHSVISWTEARQLGASPQEIRHQVGVGAWRRAHEGVFVIAGTRETYEQRLVAACLAVGIETAGSHRSAATIHGLLAYKDPPIEITTTRRRSPEREGIVDLATRAYRNAIDLDPEQPPTRPIRCVEIVAQRSATSQAKALADHVRSTMGARLDDADKKKLLKIEARIAVAEGGGAEAVKTLEEIVSLDPLDGEAIILLAQHYTRANDPGKAIFYYERAEGIDAFEADARLRHAQILVSQSHFQDAVPLLKRAQELKPREDVGRYLEQVEKLARAQR